jgi:hypothetical protein
MIITSFMKRINMQNIPSVDEAKAQFIKKAYEKPPKWKMIAVEFLVFAGLLSCGFSYLNNATSPKSSEYKEPVPVLENVASEKEALDKSYLPDNCYVVQAGDTLFSISQNLGSTVEDLASYNNIDNPSLIYPGQEICHPDKELNESSYRNQSSIDDRISDSSNIQYSVDYWVDNGKISEWSSLYGVPEKVIAALIKVESNGNPNTISSICGIYGCDLGLFQLNETFFPIDNPFDPDAAASVALPYFIEGFKKTGTLEGAYAYYNGGPSTLHRIDEATRKNVDKFVAAYNSMEL